VNRRSVRLAGPQPIVSWKVQIWHSGAMMSPVAWAAAFDVAAVLDSV